ncbi:MAG: hypothetical protein M1837_001740 [Sclerophora amabilis]|nr:MAG: hypothetical protein M1837_001740 [Sclerophora amabilis]
MAPPFDIFNRVKNYYTKDNVSMQDSPVIASQTAALLSIRILHLPIVSSSKPAFVHLISNRTLHFASSQSIHSSSSKILYTLSYVLPFYLSSATRPSVTLSRDAPSVIRARIRAVTFTCVFSTLSTYYVLSAIANVSPREAFKSLGWWPVSVPEIGKSLLLTALLFSGPLFERGIVEGDWREWVRVERAREVLSSWMGWRNYVAGPATEEIVFRSTITPLHLLAHLSPSRVVFLTPLYFGIAHVHHFYEYTLTHPDTPLLPALLRSFVQFAYTSLFGFYATFVFLRTGSLPAVILVHSFCNWCGLPRVWGRVGLESSTEVAIGPPSRLSKQRSPSPSSSSSSSSSSSLPPQDQVQVAHGQLGIAWTVAYYILLVAGAVAFWKGLGPLTESKTGLVEFAGY